jgi:hypothetical protein
MLHDDDDDDDRIDVHEDKCSRKTLRNPTDEKD